MSQALKNVPNLKKILGKEKKLPENPIEEQDGHGGDEL